MNKTIVNEIVKCSDLLTEVWGMTDRITVNHTPRRIYTGGAFFMPSERTHAPAAGLSYTGAYFIVLFNFRAFCPFCDF